MQASPQTVSDVAVPAVWYPASQLYKLNEKGRYMLIFNQNALPTACHLGCIVILSCYID